MSDLYDAVYEVMSTSMRGVVGCLGGTDVGQGECDAGDGWMADLPRRNDGVAAQVEIR